MVDVGGGRGELLAGLLADQPRLRGILLDRPQVVACAAHAARRLDGRLTVVAGDFFAAVPRGGDAYVLHQILHDRDDDRARRILASCRAAMEPGATLLVVDRILAPPNQPDPGRVTDLTMLCLLGGRERSADELRDLLRSERFVPGAPIATGTPLSVVEATAGA